MVERIESNQIPTSELPEVVETGQEDSSVEGLVAQLGVPADRAENITRAWGAVLGERTAEFLKFKIARQKEQL